jgi:ABC-type Mn2+/Zn2+ transport system permease subunit
MRGELLAPLGYEFFRNGLVVATLAGALCGLVGVYVVVKGMSYLGHGLSHAIFGGFAASALLRVDLVLGPAAWGVACALVVSGVARRRAVGSDAAIGIVTTASFALGVLLLTASGGAGQSFEAALFGSVLGVSDGDVALVAVVSAATALVLVALHRPLLFTTFDAEIAAVGGIRAARIETLLMVVVAAAVLVTMQVLGVTLVAATLVVPPTIARLLTASFPRVLAWSTAIGAACGFVGMNLSYHLDLQPGPTIVLVGAALFGAVFLTGTSRGHDRARRTRLTVTAVASRVPAGDAATRTPVGVGQKGA